MTRSVPILMYHQVSPRRHPAFRKYTVTPSAFRRHMRWLRLAGYTPVPLAALADDRASLPARPVVITFDDGYAEAVEHVVPILRTLGFHAVFFLVPGLFGQTSRWLARERGVEFPLVDTTTARALEAEGFECASHSLTHPHLADLSLTKCRRELAESRAVLEDLLGRPVRHLAYPFGSYSGDVSRAAREVGYRLACSSRAGLSRPGDDPLALRRVFVSGHDSLLDFVARLSTARPVRALAQGALARVGGGLRQAGARAA